MVAPDTAAPEGSSTCPCSPVLAAGVWPSARVLVKPQKAIAAICKEIVKRREFICFPKTESVYQRLLSSLWIRACGVRGRRTQAPRRKSHRLACAGGGRQNRFDATQQRDCGKSAGTSAIRGNDHDRISLLKIGERCSRHSTQYLLEVHLAAAGSAASGAGTRRSASLLRIWRSRSRPSATSGPVST